MTALATSCVECAGLICSEDLFDLVQVGETRELAHVGCLPVLAGMASIRDLLDGADQDAWRPSGMRWRARGVA